MNFLFGNALNQLLERSNDLLDNRNLLYGLLSLSSSLSFNGGSSLNLSGGLSSGGLDGLLDISDNLVSLSRSLSNSLSSRLDSLVSFGLNGFSGGLNGLGDLSNGLVDLNLVNNRGLLFRLELNMVTSRARINRINIPRRP